jgi:hypothetical protein
MSNWEAKQRYLETEITKYSTYRDSLARAIKSKAEILATRDKPESAIDGGSSVKSTRELQNEDELSSSSETAESPEPESPIVETHETLSSLSVKDGLFSHTADHSTVSRASTFFDDARASAIFDDADDGLRKGVIGIDIQSKTVLEASG